MRGKAKRRRRKKQLKKLLIVKIGELIIVINIHNLLSYSLLCSPLQNVPSKLIHYQITWIKLFFCPKSKVAETLKF